MKLVEFCLFDMRNKRHRLLAVAYCVRIYSQAWEVSTSTVQYLGEGRFWCKLSCCYICPEGAPSLWMRKHGSGWTAVRIWRLLLPLWTGTNVWFQYRILHHERAWCCKCSNGSMIDVIGKLFTRDDAVSEVVVIFYHGAKITAKIILGYMKEHFGSLMGRELAGFHFDRSALSTSTLCESSWRSV